MKFVVFILAYPLIWLLSKLPMRILYLKSSFFYVIIYYVIGYRKKVVLENLQLSFPEKTGEELKKIRKKFYKHFVDIFIESIKAFSISEKEIRKRYTYKNIDLVNKYAKEGRSVIIVGAHLANWEWSVNMGLFINAKCYLAYTGLKNKFFNKKIVSTRERFKVTTFKSSEIIKGMQAHFSSKQQGFYGLLSDQSPKPHKAYYWRDFLGIKVPVYTGAEMLAKRFDFVVINYAAKKVKRGYYEVEFQLITEQPRTLEDYKITDIYTEITEHNIRKQPEYYFWTHKRFKHRNKVPKEFVEKV